MLVPGFVDTVPFRPRPLPSFRPPFRPSVPRPLPSRPSRPLSSEGLFQIRLGADNARLMTADSHMADLALLRRPFCFASRVRDSRVFVPFVPPPPRLLLPFDKIALRCLAKNLPNHGLRVRVKV